MAFSTLPERIRKDFPILDRQVHGKPLVYLGNAASAQKPLAVIEAKRSSVSATQGQEQARLYADSLEAK